MKFKLVIPAALCSLFILINTQRALAADPAPSRLVQLTSAMINGVHWGQVLLHEQGGDDLPKGKGDPTLFGLGQLTLADAKDLNADFAKLLALPTNDLVAWSQENKSPSDQQIDQLIEHLSAHPAPADPRLPVNVVMAYVAKRLTGPEEFFSHAVANLAQLNLQIDKDGTQLQDLIKLYIALGMHKINLPDTDAEQIADGKTLAAQSASAPYATDAEAYHMVFKKLLVWYAKSSGAEDKTTLAKQLLQDPDVQPLIPALKALPVRRVAFLGHSLMMSIHWSTYGSWCDIAAEAMKQINPNFDYRDFQSGGLTATRAIREHLDHLLAYKPTDTYILVMVRRPEDRDALAKIVADLTAAGSRVYLVNEVRGWIKINPDIQAFYAKLAAQPNVHLVDDYALWQAGPGHDSWPAIDHIHMQTPGHLYFAKETLKQWAAGVDK